MRWLYFIIIIPGLTLAQKEIGPEVKSDSLKPFPSGKVEIIHHQPDFIKKKLEREATEHEEVKMMYSNVTFGRIFENARIISTGTTDFQIGQGNKYVFAFYVMDPPANVGRNEYRFAFELDSLPTDALVIEGSILDHYNFAYHPMLAAPMADAVTEVPSPDIHISPLNKHYFTVGFNEQDESLPQNAFTDPITGTASLYATDVDIYVYGLVMEDPNSLIPTYRWLKDRYFLGIDNTDVLHLTTASGTLIHLVIKDTMLHSVTVSRGAYSVKFNRTWEEDGAPSWDYSREMPDYGLNMHESSKGQVEVFQTVYSPSSKGLHYRDIAKGKVVDFQPTGKWKYYYPNGQVSATGSYSIPANKSGSLQSGKWKHYHANGQLLTKGKFILQKTEDGNGWESVFGKGWRHYNDKGEELSTDVAGPRQYFVPVIPDYLAEIRAIMNWGSQ